IWVDGELRHSWLVGWLGLVDPAPPFTDAPWKGGFMRWADATLPEDDAEIAIALRRACDIGMGRGVDLETGPVASQPPVVMPGICHTMQPGTVDVALRNVGSIRDFAAHPERLVSGS